MKFNTFVMVGVLLSATTASAQDYKRRAQIVGGDPFRGRCTVEVLVDGAAEVDMFGDGANLRDLSGQPAQWRRFECSAPMPRNPPDFRFVPVSGRGKQRLMRPAGDNGPAVIHIEDPQGGAGVYIFDVQWAGGETGREVAFRIETAVRARKGYRRLPEQLHTARIEFRIVCSRMVGPELRFAPYAWMTSQAAVIGWSAVPWLSGAMGRAN